MRLGRLLRATALQALTFAIAFGRKGRRPLHGCSVMWARSVHLDGETRSAHAPTYRASWATLIARWRWIRRPRDLPTRPRRLGMEGALCRPSGWPHAGRCAPGAGWPTLRLSPWIGIRASLSGACLVMCVRPCGRARRRPRHTAMGTSSSPSSRGASSKRWRLNHRCLPSTPQHTIKDTT